MKDFYYDLIKRPIVTEKTTLLGEYNKFVFEVAPNSSKELVKKAIESIFSVKVRKVNMISICGKRKRFRGIWGTRSDIKKAIVTLEKDHTIDFSGGLK